MIVLYWQLVLSRSKLEDLGLPRWQRFRWFVVAITFALVVMEIVVSVLRRKKILGAWANLVTSIIYALCLTGLSLWYFATAVRLLKLLHKVDSDTAHIRHLNRLVFASITGAGIWVIAMVFSATSYLKDPIGFVVM
jgi:hypothetical protein